MKRIQFNLIGLAPVIALALLSARTAYAQEQTQDIDGWSFRIGIPLWAAGTHGTIGAQNREVHLNESFEDALEALDFTAALNVEVRRCRWLFFLDGDYYKFSDTGEPRGLFSGIPAQVSLDQKITFNDVALGYAVVKNECLSLELFAGAQLSYSASDLTVQFPAAAPTASASRFWADPIVGAYFNYRFSKPVGFYTKGDVGGFDLSSRLTWQVEAGFDFPIAQHFYFRLAYRCLSMDYNHRGLEFNAIMRGPQIEFGVRF
jgi:hypothetical protein